MNLIIIGSCCNCRRLVVRCGGGGTVDNKICPICPGTGSGDLFIIPLNCAVSKRVSVMRYKCGSNNLSKN